MPWPHRATLLVLSFNFACASAWESSESARWLRDGACQRLDLLQNPQLRHVQSILRNKYRYYNGSTMFATHAPLG